MSTFAQLVSGALLEALPPQLIVTPVTIVQQVLSSNMTRHALSVRPLPLVPALPLTALHAQVDSSVNKVQLLH
jgi:hypothetical protein